MEWADGKCRCRWANPKNERYIRYHDEEWGQPVHDDRKLFEMLVLETFQAGLSWECVLNKQDAFIEAFDGFDPEIVASYMEVLRRICGTGLETGRSMRLNSQVPLCRTGSLRI